MYYFFRAKLVYWKDELLQAIAINEPSREHAKNWWYGESFAFPSYEFSFSIHEQGPLLDNYWTGNIFDLYSEKLISILKDAKVSYESFPVKLIGKINGEVLNLDYKVFRLTEISDCLDENRSTYKLLSLGKRQIRSLQQPFFTDDFMKSGELLTRIAGHEKHIIIHEELKEIIEHENISGCKFSEQRLDESALFE